jgi:PIN domain nuclease of toxin-antitoxin system
MPNILCAAEESQLANAHRDLFDRMLAAQVRAEDLILVAVNPRSRRWERIIPDLRASHSP